MAWVERIAKRTRYSRTWQDSATGVNRLEIRAKTPLHYESVLDSKVYDAEIDMTPVRVNNDALDGWIITQNGWHYALGTPKAGVLANLDGVVGFGGRKGAHWLKFRLQRMGYLNYTNKKWQDVRGAVTYNRANLSSKIETLQVGPNGDTVRVQNTATWDALWSGVSVSWKAQGDSLKEEITISQAAREALPKPQTGYNWFGFLFWLDVSDIPRWVKNSVQQGDDFDDADGTLEIRDALDRLLALLPIDYAWSTGDPEQRVLLRKRVWRDGSGNWWLLIGARVTDLANLPAGAVIFDPTLSLQPDPTAGLDARIREDQPTTNYGTHATLIVGFSSGTYARWRSLIKFDLSSLPDDAVISSTTLSLYMYAEYSSNAESICVYRQKRAWVESQVTWNVYSTGNSWQTPGGFGTDDCEQTYIGSLAYSATEPAGWKNISITVASKAALDLGNGWLLKMSGEANSSEYDHYSSDYTTDISLRPKLVVEYVEASNDLFVSVSDGVTVSDTPALVASYLATSVTDSISIAENVSVTGLGTIQVAVEDGIAVSDSLETVALLRLEVIDSATLTESVGAALSSSSLAIDSEIISAKEQLSVCISVSVDCQETIPVTDAPAVVVLETGGVSGSVSDAVAIAESVQAVLSPLLVDETEDITVADVPAVQIIAVGVIAVSVVESVTVDDQGNATVLSAGTLEVDNADIVLVGDSSQIAITAPPTIAIVAAETIATGESQTVAIVETGAIYISVAETSAVREIVTASLPEPLTVEVRDEIALTDSSVQQSALVLAVTDAIYSQDVLGIEALALPVDIQDTVQIEDYPAINPLELEGINVQEILTATDAVTASVSILSWAMVALTLHTRRMGLNVKGRWLRLSLHSRNLRLTLKRKS